MVEYKGFMLPDTLEEARYMANYFYNNPGASLTPGTDISQYKIPITDEFMKHVNYTLDEFVQACKEIVDQYYSERIDQSC